MKTRYAFAALALSLIAGLGLWADQTEIAPGQTLLPGMAASAQEAAAPLPAVPDMVLGNAEAKVTVTEYASFTCPHCAAFHASVFKPLRADYIDTGKVRFVYREVFFDRYGLWGAMLARCGGDTRYFGISSVLYDTQSEWAASEDLAVVVENLRRIGRTAGMDDTQIDACLNDRAMAEALVANYQEKAAADGVDSTPTLIINGTKHANMSYDELKAILDAELAK